MATFKVTIPNSKKTFFLEFLKLLGAEFEEKQENFELSDEQKEILDKQEDLNISEYQDNDEFLKELKKEHDL